MKIDGALHVKITIVSEMANPSPQAVNIHNAKLTYSSAGGGSWSMNGANCRTAARWSYPPEYTNASIESLGFRVVFAP